MNVLGFAHTKIQPPRLRAGLIERPDLEQNLGDALMHAKLVMLAAPSGYGKTSALARQLLQLPPRTGAAWLTADRHDDLPRFLNCLAAALEPLEPSWRIAPAVLAELASTPSGPRTGADEFVNALSATTLAHGVIVVDDTQAIVDPRVFEFLSMLVERLPDHWTLAIATRIDPPLPLARMRARGELVDFRQGELRFTAEEVRRLSRNEGKDCCDEFAQELHQRTQGWAACVCLCLVEAERGRDANVPTGRLSQRHLFDFFAAEVFEPLPAELREFLLCCSVLSELTPENCAAVSQNPRAADLLEEAERHGLLMPEVEGNDFTLRLHDLFGKYLADRLKRDTPAQLRTLLLRAAEQECEPERKLDLLIRAGAWKQAEAALAAATYSLLSEGNSALALRYADQFPEHVLERSPSASFVRGLDALCDLDWPVLQQTMEHAARGFEQEGRPREAGQANALLALALLGQGRIEQSRRAKAPGAETLADVVGSALWELVAYCESGCAGPSRGPALHLDRLAAILASVTNPELWHRCTAPLFMCIGRVGVKAPMERFVDGAFRAAGEDNKPLHAAASVLRAWLLLWSGDLDQANGLIRKLQADSQGLRHPRGLQVSLMHLRAIHGAMRGEAATARASLDELLRDAAEPGRAPHVRAMQISLAGRCAAALGDWNGVRRALSALEAAHIEGSGDDFMLRSLRSQLDLHEGRTETALISLRKLVAGSADSDRLGSDASVRIHLAIAELRSGWRRAAWEAVVPLIRQFRNSGEIGGALLCGSGLLDELAHAAWGSAVPQQEAAALHQWARVAREFRQRQIAADGADMLTESRLSSRELDVLSFVAAGHSNKVIARELMLSPHTIKRHVARILDKLELESRGQAAAWLGREHARRPERRAGAGWRPELRVTA